MNCPRCGRHCNLEHPNCERGVEYAKQIAEGKEPELEESGHHGQHGHRGPMKPPETLADYFRACGHRLHHGGMEAEEMFDRLTDEEKETLLEILKKLV